MSFTPREYGLLGLIGLAMMPSLFDFGMRLIGDNSKGVADGRIATAVLENDVEHIKVGMDTMRTELREINADVDSVKDKTTSLVIAQEQANRLLKENSRQIDRLIMKMDSQPVLNAGYSPIELENYVVAR